MLCFQFSGHFSPLAWILITTLDFPQPPLSSDFRFYTIRYRERNRKWIYQTCPTSDTVIDNLKPNTPYEFGVRSNKDDRRGTWSKPVIHNTNMGGEDVLQPHFSPCSYRIHLFETEFNSVLFFWEFTDKNAQKLYKLRNPLAKPLVRNLSQSELPHLHYTTTLPAIDTSSFNSQDSTSSYFKCFHALHLQNKSSDPKGLSEPWAHTSLSRDPLPVGPLCTCRVLRTCVCVWREMCVQRDVNLPADSWADGGGGSKVEVVPVYHLLTSARVAYFPPSGLHIWKAEGATIKIKK